MDKCNNPFPDGGEINSCTRPTTIIQPHVTNGCQSTKDSMKFLTTSSVTSLPRTTPTRTTAPSAEEESEVATTQITEISSTADQPTSTTRREIPNITTRFTTTTSSTPITEATSNTLTEATTSATALTTTSLMATTSSKPFTETTSTTNNSSNYASNTGLKHS